MRVTFQLNIQNPVSDSPRFPAGYHEVILAYLKDSIRLGDELLKAELWDGNIRKPFTCALYFPGIRKTGRWISFAGNSFYLHFSTGYYPFPTREGIRNGFEIFTALYNGMVKRRGPYVFDFTGYNGERYEIKPGRVFKAREPEFTGEKPVTFKTLSPVAIRKTAPGQKPEWLYPDHPHYREWMEKSIRARSRLFLGREDFPLDFQPGEYKKVGVYLFKSVVNAFSGTFQLQAPPKVLQMVYETGLGARVSQGFGMVEVVGS